MQACMALLSGHFVKINNDPTVGCLGRSQLKGLADRDFSGRGQP